MIYATVIIAYYVIKYITVCESKFFDNTIVVICASLTFIS